MWKYIRIVLPFKSNCDPIPDANQMTKEVVATSVPNSLRQLRALSGYQHGRDQISEMLDVAGQNISVENTTLTPEERAWLYYRMQLSLAYETDLKRETVSHALIILQKTFLYSHQALAALVCKVMHCH